MRRIPQSRTRMPSPQPSAWAQSQVCLWLLMVLVCTILCTMQQVQTQNPDQRPQGNFRNQQDYESRQHRRERVAWCTTNFIERRKCLDWARAVEEVNSQLDGQEPFKLNLDCVQGADKDQCMGMIDDERADMILLDPGEIGVAGRFHSLTPIMVERYGASKSEFGHYSVAVVKKRSAPILQSLSDLYGKRACFSGVSHMASWTLPLASLIDLPQFEIVDCNNLVKSASYFFGNSCAPNALINKFNPTGDNPQKMSILCDRPGSRLGSAPSESYSGALSALKCLVDPLVSTSGLGSTASGSQLAGDLLNLRGGDVAFIPHNTIFLAEKLNLPRELRAEIPSRLDLELLCPQGGRAPLDKWQTCNFGFVPAHAVIVSSRTSAERKENIQHFLRTSVQLFSGPESSSILGPELQQSSNGFRLPSPPTQAPVQQTQSSFSFDSGFFSSIFGSSSQQQQQQANQAPSQSRSLDRQSMGASTLAPLTSRISSSFRLTGERALLNYPSLDVLFSSDMSDLVPLLGAAQTVKGFLNSFPVQLSTSSQAGNARPSNEFYYPSYYQTKTFSDGSSSSSNFEIRQQTDYFEKLRRCTVPAAVLCVTSEREFNKCLAMSKAFHAASLRPELNCKLASSSLACMQLIKNRDADLVVLDAADIYLAGAKFNLIPIIAEQIEMADPNVYAVAVAKKSDQSSDLFTLKGKLSCHSGFLKGAGWVMPLNFLLSNDKMRIYDDCNSALSASVHFDKSCAPGALSSLSGNTNSSSSSWTVRNLCELCHGTGRSYCARDASEPFYGDTGAFRCLVEGGGEVAFCKHTAIFENTGGSNRETWARNLIRSDFELLCRDGSRAPVNEYKSCNLGSVPPSAMTTRGDTPMKLIEAYVNLFMYGQQYYGSKYTEEYTFKMFSSSEGHDLIFQDATQQIVRVPLRNQTYLSYLHYEFLRAMESVFCSPQSN